ncbi:AAA family ATPase [Herbaspirillum sp. GCM10030257]|uniref:AAA family ATPase n=1 Tax=Herbaspirillum sp. GCM10030257 TaxID=3273393 RepID=UPI00360C0E6B
MMIQNFTKDQFGVRLNEVVSPSHPVRSIELLEGREREIENISRSLYAPGRHIFIYGDRGVGKSSLAATAAYQYQSPEAAPIFVSGSMTDTFVTIITNIVQQALGRSKTESVKRTNSIGFEWKVKANKGSEITSLDISSQIRSVGDAAELLKEIQDQHSKLPIVVLDEFDTIVDPAERAKFAALLKQLGDQEINLKFIFTGIGTTLDELLGAHHSAFRQLDTVHLNRLDWNSRRAIVDRAASRFGLSVDNNVNWRIAAVSDGFPYYIHLLMEKMLWEAFSDQDEIAILGWEHFHLGLRVAIESINAELKRPYEMAVSHRPEEFEDIVWSTADGEELFRSLDDLYQAYKAVLRKRLGRPELDRKKYSDIIRRLKGQAFGEILTPLPNRTGWYTYKEKMLRGYVRMQAEANGIELSGEREAPKQKMHIPGNAKTGFRGPSLPPGVRASNEIRKSEESD